MAGIFILLATIITLAIPIALLILIILGIKALIIHLNAEKQNRIINEEIEQIKKEVDEIEREIKQRNDT